MPDFISDRVITAAAFVDAKRQRRADCCEVGSQVPGHLTANQMECLCRVLAAQHDEDAMAKKPAKKKTKGKAKAKGKSKSKKK